MSIRKQSFKVDLFQLKNARDAGALMDSIKAGHARDLGKAIIEEMPYERIEGFEGELPAAVLTKDHIFTETWGVEFMLLNKQQVAMLMDLTFELERAGEQNLADQLKHILKD